MAQTPTQTPTETSTPQYASIDDLFGSALPEETEDVELSTGRVVKVRGLTRYELLLNAKGVEDALTIERRNVATCLVAPAITEEQVQTWKKTSRPGDIGKVTDAIRRLSGLGQGAGKSDVPGDGVD